MERQVSESQSDSDSGESWMLLDFASSYTTTKSPSPSPVLCPTESHREGVDKDDDTDGISIISECESDTDESCEHVQREECASAVSVASRAVERDDDATDYRLLLGDHANTKTYVHRRNTRVSSALNVIVFGSVVTAACLAIGHMWGARDECLHHDSSSFNKLLSNLYKLQEENSYLRSKLRELTLAGHGQLQLKRNSTPKQCKNVPQEPPQRANVGDTDDCVDAHAKIESPLLKYVKTQSTRRHVEIDENEKQFHDDLQKLRKMYEENRGWLERQLTKRLQNEKEPPTRQNANVEISEKNIDRSGVHRAVSNPVRSKVPAATRGDRTEQSQRSSSNEKNGHELKHEMLEDEFSPPEEKRPTKLKRERFVTERSKSRDAKIKNDKYEKRCEAENASRHSAKFRDRVCSRDKKCGPDYDKLSHSDRQNAKKQKKETKTNFIIVDRESERSKKQRNYSAGDLSVGDWSQKRSEMRRRARQDMSEMAPRRGASGRWYFRRKREREQLRARSARNLPRQS